MLSKPSLIIFKGSINPWHLCFLPIIYLAFISLGLPDALLGAAWPTMYPQLGAQVSWAGGVSMIISACTILSALASDRLNERLGTGRVTAISVATTAAALFGFSFCHAFWQLCLWAIPYGLGAGSVDAALNNYVALHYKSRHMSWLHCMGVGASLGPVIMGQALAGSGWQGGYRIIGILQVVLTVVLLFSLPLWKLPQDAMGGEPFTPQHRSFPELLKITGVPEVLVCFFVLLRTGIHRRDVGLQLLHPGARFDAQTAASWASLFYLGITAGRFVSGFLTMKMSDRNMIRLGQVLIALGILLVLLPAGNNVLFVGLILIGLGCAPVYPCIIHETPVNFGRELSMSMTGLQMAFAYVGSCLAPPLFGLLAQNVTPQAVPPGT